MRKWLFISLAVLLFLAGAGVISTFLYLRKNFPPEKIRTELELQLSQRSGFDVRMGEVDFTSSGWVKIGRVCARNAEMKSERCFVLAENITLEVALLPLLSKKLEIKAARVATLAIHLFEETAVAKGGSKTVLHSWDAKKAAAAEAAGGGRVPAFSIGTVGIDAGELVRDVSLPPLPAGKTRFNLRYRGSEPSHLESTVFFFPQGEAKLHLTAQGENLVTALIQLFRKRQLSEGVSLAGKIECRNCPLDAAETRLKSFSGNAELQLTGSLLQAESKEALLSVVSPLSGEFKTNAKLPLQLADFSVTNGEVSLARPGLALTLSKLNRQATTGMSANFSLAAEMAALGVGSGITGHLSGGGQILRGTPSGAFTVTGFSFPLRPKLVISSPRFNAMLNGESISLKGQSFRLNDSAFLANLSLARTGGITRLNGAVDFPQLDLSALTETDGQASAGNPAAGGRGDITLRTAVGELRAGKWRLSQFKGELVHNAAGMQIENATAGLAQGRVQFAYRRPRDGGQSLRLQAQGLKAQIISDNLALPGTVYGLLSTTANLQFTGDAPESIRRTLSGTIAAELGRGKIKNSFLQKGILTGPLHKLEDKFSDIEFAQGSVDARFSNGAIEIKKLWFDAEEWNAQLRAEANSEGQGKAALNFRFRSSFVENAANPLHLGIGSRKEGDFYDLPFACRGNVFSGACYKQNW